MDWNHERPPGLRPAPSARIPVTPENRPLLRWLRTAEQAAWLDARPAHEPKVRTTPAKERRLFRLRDED